MTKHLYKILKDITDGFAARLIINELATDYLYMDSIEDFFKARTATAHILNLEDDYQTEQRFMAMQQAYGDGVKDAYLAGFKTACRMLKEYMEDLDK